MHPGAKVINAYGTTEAGPVVFGPHPGGLPQPEMSVGYPHPKVALRLIGDNGRVAHKCPEMKRPAVMLGYHNRPDLPPPITQDISTALAMFRRDADGFHYAPAVPTTCLCPAAKTSIRRCRAHVGAPPAVAQACVVPIDDDIKGQKLVAFVIAKAGQQPDAEDTALRAHQCTRLPAPAASSGS